MQIKERQVEQNVSVTKWGIITVIRTKVTNFDSKTLPVFLDIPNYAHFIFKNAQRKGAK